MTADLNKIAENKLRNAVTGESAEMKSFWENEDAAIFFFRRWGCVFCRLWAKEISEISTILKNHNIRVIGVGVEEIGSKDFIEGNFFDGELYYVENRSTYQNLGFKRFNTFSILTSLLWKDSREAISKGNRMHLGGDMKGDWVQVGGALFVKKGGSVLQHFVQERPAEHISNQDVLKLFNLENEYKPKEKAGASETVVPWLLKPAMSFHEMKTTASRSLAETWKNRHCRRRAEIPQQRFLLPNKPSEKSQSKI